MINRMKRPEVASPKSERLLVAFTQDLTLNSQKKRRKLQLTTTKVERTMYELLLRAITGAGIPTKAGTAAPALTPSAEVFTVRPVLLLATAGPVVNSPIAKVIFEVPTGKSAVAVVHTMVRFAAVNVQVDVRAAAPDTGTRVPAGVALPLK